MYSDEGGGVNLADNSGGHSRVGWRLLLTPKPKKSGMKRNYGCVGSR